jgi:hypothetical protein
MGLNKIDNQTAIKENRYRDKENKIFSHITNPVLVSKNLVTLPKANIHE